MVSTIPMAIQPSSVSTSGAASANMARSSDSRRVMLYRALFSYAEGGENPVQDIVRRCRAGNGINGPQRGVEIQQQHLMRDAERGCGAGLLQSLAGFLQELFMAETRDETAFLFQPPAGSNGFNDGPAQFREALTSERGNTQRAGCVRLRWQIALV